MNVTVIIPALNETGCIADLVRDVQAQPVTQIIVVDNGSTDGTGATALLNLLTPPTMEEQVTWKTYTIAEGISIKTQVAIIH